MKNKDLLKEVIPTESELKSMIVNYVGKALNPDEDMITVEQVVEVFSKEFPEFLLAVAEENWISGYTQALKDTEGVSHDIKKLYSSQANETV